MMEIFYFRHNIFLVYSFPMLLNVWAVDFFKKSYSKMSVKECKYKICEKGKGIARKHLYSSFVCTALEGG